MLIPYRFIPPPKGQLGDLNHKLMSCVTFGVKKQNGIWWIDSLSLKKFDVLVVEIKQEVVFMRHKFWSPGTFYSIKKSGLDILLEYKVLNELSDAEKAAFEFSLI